MRTYQLIPLEPLEEFEIARLHDLLELELGEPVFLLLGDHYG